MLLFVYTASAHLAMANPCNDFRLNIYNDFYPLLTVNYKTSVNGKIIRDSRNIRLGEVIRVDSINKDQSAYVSPSAYDNTWVYVLIKQANEIIFEGNIIKNKGSTALTTYSNISSWDEPGLFELQEINRMRGLVLEITTDEGDCATSTMGQYELSIKNRRSFNVRH